MNKAKRYEFDVIIVGSGIAGLSAAATAAEQGLRVAVITKGIRLIDANTWYAQGGIVGSSDSDSPDLLERDIVNAGGGINSREAVQLLVKNGPKLVDEFLIEKLQVPFSKSVDGRPDLTKEAAHSVRRIYHAKDTTGKAILEAMIPNIEASEGISLFPNHTAIDLITNIHNSTDPERKYHQTRVIGLYSLDGSSSEVAAFFAPSVILATGGVGNLYLHTSNPVGANGDGVAMAYRIGAEVLNTEYIQFHPTVLFHRDRKRFLISETLRGEGARLLNKQGEEFTERYIPNAGDMGPRDEVSRAIYREMEREESDYVSLDATRIRDIDPADRFPSIYQTCLSLGIDIRKEPIPVVPAAHYFCGGVKVDLWGKTSIAGLFSAGETACTGLHGANRLASVSLLEGLVWGVRCGEAVARDRFDLPKSLIGSVPDWIDPRIKEEFDPVLVKQDFRTIQSTMWNYAGIIRSRKRLMRAQADLDYLSHRIEQFYRGAKLSRRIIELRNSVLTSIIIVRAALANPVSKGCHYIE